MEQVCRSAVEVSSNGMAHGEGIGLKRENRIGEDWRFGKGKMDEATSSIPPCYTWCHSGKRMGSHSERGKDRNRKTV